MPLSLQIAICAYHTTRCLELGSVIFEAKDRAYDPFLAQSVILSVGVIE